MENAKGHLKEGSFQNMVNQKYYSTQHQFDKIINIEMISPWLKK